jgi:hypothetical protein
MIQTLMQTVKEAESRTGLPRRCVCAHLHVPWASLGRWRYRTRTGAVLVRPPGPAKLVAPDMAVIRGQVKLLAHGLKRTAGTAALYACHRESISRRELAQLVAQAREECNREKREQLQRVSWLRTGVAWSMDATECEQRSVGGLKVFAHQLEELCSRYRFAPIGGEYPTGEQIAAHLDRHLSTHCAPLLLKRDNGGNMNHPSVDDVLAQHFVLPLNSPLNCARYNGAVEHAQGEFKKQLDIELADVKLHNPDDVQPYARAAAHQLNHISRDCLKGRNSCQVFFDPAMRVTFTRTERSRAYEWIAGRQNDITDKAGSTVTALAAWRVAVKQWLLNNGLLTISINNGLSPN